MMTQATRSTKMFLMSVTVLITLTESQTTEQSFSVSPGKILLYPVSHCYNSLLLSMEKMASFLSKEGYDVTMLVNDNYQGTKSDLDMSKVTLAKFPAPSNVPTLCDMEEMISAANASMLDITNVWLTSASRFCDALLQTDILGKLNNSKFDLAIVDRSDWCSAIIADALNIPFMTFASVNTAFSMEELVRDTHVPSIFSSTNWPMTFIDRMTTALTHILVYLARVPTLPRMNELKVEYKIHPDRHITEVYDSAVLNLLNSDHEVEYPRPLYSHEVEMGFLFSEISPTTIPQNMLDFIDKGDIVVVSFGSHVAKLSPRISDILLQAFFQLSHVNFIWRVKEFNHTLPNVLNAEWVPQSALVASGRISLLVTHGGLASAMESIYNGVPMLVLPMQTEQHTQASKLRDYVGVADTLDIHELTVQKLVMSIQRGITSNTAQRIQVSHLSQSIQKRPIKSSEILLHWINHTIKNKGRNSPKRPKYKNFFEWYLLDFFFLVLALFITTLYCLIMCCKYLKAKT